MHLTGEKKKVGGVLSSDLSKHRVRRDVHIHIIKYAKDYSSQDLYIVKCLSRMIFFQQEVREKHVVID
jgi:hypothetical protein